MIAASRLHVIHEEIASVIQQATFMIVDTAADAGEAEFRPNVSHWAQVEYDGPSQGSVCICADWELIQALSMNMLGIGDTAPVEPGKALDSFKELANIITGRIITLLYGVDKVFRLSTPQYFTQTPLQCSEALVYRFAYDCEGMPLYISLFVHCEET